MVIFHAVLAQGLSRISFQPLVWVQDGARVWHGHLQSASGPASQPDAENSAGCLL
jgi:hypothetical protein